jgi:thiol reductant ABC exporter CydD subunit
VLHARPAGLGDLRTGEVATSATSGLDALDPYFVRFLPQFALAVVVSPAILVWVALHDLVSALIMLVTLPLIPLFAVLIGRAAQERTERRLAALSIMSSHFLDVVRGLATLRAYRRGKAQSETISCTSEEFRRETMGTLRIAFLSAFALELGSTLSIALIAAVIGLRLINGSVALAPSFMVLVLAPELYLPLRGLAAQFHASTDGLAAARRAFELIDLPAAVSTPAVPVAIPDLSAVSLRFEQVGFDYEGRGGPLITGFDGEIKAGERTFITGESGAGKTTLLSLLMRFADPQQGRVSVGGVDLRELDPDEWRRKIAWLPQRPRLLAGTIAAAVRIGAAEAGEEELWSALVAAGAAELVAALPDGLETRIGDGGVPLSAGELRRIALARALVREAPLLVLDEPTAHLDSLTAAQIRLSLGALGRRRTIVVATHDPSLFVLADRLIELPDAVSEAPA